jgi:diguanylate cyclase (GGDEF)-like protein
MSPSPKASAVAIAVGGASLYAVLSHVDGDSRAIIGNAAVIVAPICGLASTVAAWRRTRERAWLLLGGFCALWATGQMLWTYFELVAHRPLPFPSLADAGYVGGAAFAIAASTQLPRRAAVSTVIAVLDGLLVALSLVIVGLAVLAPAITAADPRQQWLGIAYPATDAAALTALVTSLTSVAPRWRRQLLYVVAGFTAIAIADTGFAVLISRDEYSTGHPVDLGWVAGFLLIALGAVGAPAPNTTTWRAKREQPTWAAILVPYIAVMSAAAAVLIVQLTRSTLDPVFVYLGVSVVPLAALRHALTLRESERRATALDREITYDTLTGLWNRRTMSRTLDQLVAAGEDVAVVVIDIDDFKNVNDCAGPSAGDLLLCEMAERLRQSVSPPDLVARVGGDEFAVVFRDGGRPDGAVSSLTPVLATLAAPFTVGSSVRKLTVSAGIATPEHASNGSDLLGNANLAMHTAKRRGKNRYADFEPEVRADAVKRIELMAELEHSVSRGELVLHYQPLFRLDDGSLVGAEALIRWQHPTRGLLAPNVFIPIAESGAHIETIGAWVLREATRFTAALIDSQVVDSDFHVAVNVAARQLYGDRFIETLDEALEQAPLAPSSLVIELTESSLIDIGHALPTLSAIRARGIRIAVDDFGTGYSSLSYLHQLPLDILKVDRSFVAQMDRTVELRAMTRAIVSIGHSLGLATVAEGVERPAQLDELRTCGCTAAQGYLWSPPVPGAELIQMLSEDRWRTSVFS